ncbi:MAG: 1-acyl-sn-glycerol-3-phosphate acyltransferase [Planctomycetota bacterium]|nr:MAG: 1-acyl-sn-glycerol-3-phosphate acyltransferase [Planctomycetota bacterium]
MRPLRATLRLALLLALVLALFPLALATRALAACGAERAALRAAARVQRAWARATLWGMGVRIDAGAARWPQLAGGLLVCNHVSWLDIPVLAACAPLRFVAKGEIAHWPLFGWMSRSVGTLFIARGRARDVATVQRELAASIESGVFPLVFPEGRATDGRAVRAFHAGLLEIAPRGGWPCFAFGLRYPDPPREPGAAATFAWHDGTPLWVHVWRVLGERRIDVRVRCSGPHAPLARRELARALEREVAALAGVPVEGAGADGAGNAFPAAEATR